MWTWLKSLFSKDDELEQISLFQLEGLVRNQVPFLLLDLRKDHETLAAAEVEKLVSTAHKVNVDGVESFLTEKSYSETHPVVLVCEKGRKSKRLALQLRKKGRVNIYFIKGGVCKLEEEWSQAQP